HRVFRFLHRNAGLALVVVGGLLFLLALWVEFAPGPGKDGATRHWLEALHRATSYFSMRNDPARHATWPQWLAVLLSWLFFVIIAAKAVVFLFAESLTALRLRSTQGHIVICGAGRIGRQLVASLSDHDPSRVVVIERDQSHPDLGWLREQGVVILLRSAQRRDALREARAAWAREVFVCTGSDEVNLECVQALREEVAEVGQRPPPVCRVHLRDGELASVIRVANGESHHANVLPVEVFNTTERSTQLLLQSLAAKGHLPMADTEVGHVVIIGFGEFGQSLAVALAEVGHFPNVARLRMTIADFDIAPKAEAFLARYPRFARRDCVPVCPADAPLPAPLGRPRSAADEWSFESRPGIGHVCTAAFVNLTDVAEERWVGFLDKALRQKTVKPIVFVTFDRDGVNFTAAHRLAAMRDRVAPPAKRWPIYYWVPLQTQFAGAAGAAEPARSADAPIAFGNCLDAAGHEIIANHWTDRLAKTFKMVYTAVFPTVPADSASASVTEKARAGLTMLRDCCAEANASSAKSRCATFDEIDKIADEVWKEEPLEARRAIDRSAAIHAVIKLAACGIGLDSCGSAVAGCGQTACCTSWMRCRERNSPENRRSSGGQRPWMDLGHGLVDGATPTTAQQPPESDPEAVRVLDRLRQAAMSVIGLTAIPDEPDESGFDAADFMQRPFGKAAFGWPALPSDADGHRLRQLVRMEHYRWCAERLLAGWSYAAKPPEDAPAGCGQTACGTSGMRCRECNSREKRSFSSGQRPWMDFGHGLLDRQAQRDTLRRQFRHGDLRVFEELEDREKAKNHLPVHLLLALAAQGRLLRAVPLDPIAAAAAPAPAATVTTA
ncbi:MAG: NAD-binding protein, partial [Pirellulales bacterium]